MIVEDTIETLQTLVNRYSIRSGSGVSLGAEFCCAANVRFCTLARVHTCTKEHT